MQHFITAKDNKKIKMIRGLLEKPSHRKKEKAFIVEGIKMVNEALALQLVLEIFESESFYSSSQSKDNVNPEIKKLNSFLSDSSEFFIVSDSIFKSMTDTVTPQGILAVVKMPEYNMETILSKKKLKILFLEDISDPGNLGTMFRTAEAAGMTAIFMTKNTVDLFNPKTVRSTMGSVFRMPFIYLENIDKEILRCKMKGLSFYAAHLKGKKSYKEISYSDRTAILIGNEARGLSEWLSNQADEYLKIPMQGEVESLNAAIAAALIMYEIE